MVQLMVNNGNPDSDSSRALMERLQPVFDDEEELETVDGKTLLPPVPPNRGPPNIHLATLINFALHTVYHELTVLSELLPKKMDADRKISIVQFAHSTRMLFIKILAVVKWLKMSRKIECCSSINFFLEQQTGVFVDTADKLVSLAREELTFARMPAFQIPSAVDVLTLGQYPRLPQCIKTRFVTDKAISEREQVSVLRRLNLVIQRRLASAAKLLPARIKNVLIRNGMVTLTVPGEFEVSLTILGELASTPWTLLNIRILVEDYDIGYGTGLVHPLQINFLHQIVQARMTAAQTPLIELYQVLHTFAQGLQLDLLYCQTRALIMRRLGERIHIDKYQESSELTICYWSRRAASSPSNTTHFKISITTDQSGSNDSLLVVHWPKSGDRVEEELPDLDERSGRLCIDRLLTDTMLVRCKQRLAQLRDRLDRVQTGRHIALTGDAAPLLTTALLETGVCHPDELLSLSVSMHTGRLTATIPALGKSRELREFERHLDSSTTFSSQNLKKTIEKLRVQLMVERCKKSVTLLPIRLMPESTLLAHSAKVKSIPKDRVCFQFVREEAYYLIVTFVADDICGVQIDFYLLSNTEANSSLVHLKPSQMVQSSVGLTSLPVVDASQNEFYEPPQKKQKRWLGNSVELAGVVAIVDDRICFMRIRDELDKRHIRYKPVETEPIIGGLKLSIISFGECVPWQGDDFFNKMISCSLRQDSRARVVWMFEMVFADPPLVSRNTQHLLPSIKSQVIDIQISHSSAMDELVSKVVENVLCCSKLYSIVKPFAVNFKQYFSDKVQIYSYSFYKLTIAYGPKMSWLITIRWLSKNEQFCFRFGIAKCSDETGNPHTLMGSILQNKFNRNSNLSELMHVLVETGKPLSYLQRTLRRQLHSSRQDQPDSTLPIHLPACLIPIDALTVRLTYRLICIEFRILSKDRIALRDCAAAPNIFGMDLFWKKYVSSDIDQIECKTTTDVPSSYSPMARTCQQQLAAQNNSPAANQQQSPSVTVTANPATPNVLDSPIGAVASYVDEKRSGDEMRCGRWPLLIDCSALDTVTVIDSRRDSILISYLFAVSYINKMSTFVRKLFTKDQLLKNVQTNVDSVQFAVPLIGNSAGGSGMVSFNVFVDQNCDMKLKLQLVFGGEGKVPADEVQILERYFVLYAAPSMSELALGSFITICRLPWPNGQFTAFTQFMQAQMDTSYWGRTALWRPSLELIARPVSKDKVKMGVQIEQKDSSFQLLMCIKLRTNPLHEPKRIHTETKNLTLLYNSLENRMQLYPSQQTGQSAQDHSAASILLLNQSETSAKLGDCSIWPAIRALAEYFDPTKSGR